MALSSPLSTPSIIDPFNTEEVMRQYNKDGLYHEIFHEFVPDQEKAFSPVHVQSPFRLLDIGCGAGAWSVRVAQEYPFIQVIGIDISQKMIQFAKDIAHLQGFPGERVQFHCVDATKPLPYPDASFQVIRGRFLLEFLSTTQWPALIAECYRLLQPGGRLILTEFEPGQSNAPATQCFTHHFLQAMWKAGRSFSPDGSNIGVCYALEPMFAQHRFQQVSTKAYPFNFSYGMDWSRTWLTNQYQLFVHASQFICKHQDVSPQEMNTLLSRIQQENESERYLGYVVFQAFWGVKP